MRSCSACGGRSLVKDSRENENDYGQVSIYRRRECTVCGHTWSTYEVSSEDFVSIRHNEKIVNMISEIFEHRRHGRLSHLWLNAKSSRRPFTGGSKRKGTK